MPDRPQSAWLDFTDWVKDPAYVAMNWRDPAKAKRYLANFLSGPIDAVLPGDVIPSALLPEDKYDANPLAEIAANPLTWTALIPGVGPRIGNALRAGASAAYRAMPDAAKPWLDDARRSLGWDDYSKPMVLPDLQAPLTPPAGWPVGVPHTKTFAGKTIDPQTLLNRASGVEQLAHNSQLAGIEAMTRKAGLPTPEEQKILHDAMLNLDYTAGGKVPSVLVPGWQPNGMSLPDRIQGAKDRVDMLLAKGMQGDQTKLHALIEQTYAHNERQLAEAISKRAISPGRAQGDYLLKQFTNMGPGASNKARSLNTAEDVVQFLRENPGQQLKRNWVDSMMERGAKQGSLLKRAYLRDELTDPSVSVHLLGRKLPGFVATPESEAADALMSRSMQAAVPDSDTWARLRYELEGSPPSGRIADLASSVNRVFKPAAVYGVGPFVRVGSIVRNQLTALWELAGSPEGRRYMLQNPGMVASNLLGAFDDGVVKNLGFKRLTGGEITQGIDAIEAAMKASGGQFDNTIATLVRAGKQDVADALTHGVMQGYVTSEQLLSHALTLRNTVNPATWIMPGQSAVANMGSAVFGGLEQRMRLGAFLDFRKQGMPVEKAAQLVKDTFLDYDVTSAGNRTLRQVFPFAQFVVKSMKQQGKLLADNPAVLPAVAALYGGDSDLPDYARSQAHVGNVLPGMAPTDVFGMVPDVTGSRSFEEFMQSAKPAASALHPLIGAGIGVASGVDTFTGRPYLKDARLPGRDPRSTDRTALDTAYGLAEDTGLAQPFAGPAQQVKSLSRMTGPTAALRFATGVNVVQPPEPAAAEAARLRASLSTDPRVQQFQKLFSRSEDPQLQAALKRLAEVQRELSAARSAAQPPSAP